MAWTPPADAVENFVPPSDAVIAKPPVPQNTGVNLYNSFRNSLREGVGAISEPIAKMGSSIVAKPLSEAYGLGAILAGRDNPTEDKKAFEESLTYQPQTTLGKSDYNPLNAIPNGIGWLVNKGSEFAGDTVRGGTREQVPSDTVRGVSGNAVAEAIPQALSFIGIKGAPKAGDIAKDAVAAKQAALDTTKSQALERDTVTQAGRDAGFVVTPGELSKDGGGHIVGQMAESVGAYQFGHGGGDLINKFASIKNTKIGENLVRQDLTLPNGKTVPESMPISEKSLSEFRDSHSGPYKAISAIDEPIKYTPEYANAINDLNSKFKAAQDQYPTLMKNDQLTTLQNELLKKTKPELIQGVEVNVPVNTATNGKAAIQLIQKLREEANATYKSTASKAEDLAGAKLKKEAAKVLEDLVAQHLEQTGKKALYDSFVKSRTQMAKAYELEAALSGNRLSLGKLAKSDGGLDGNMKLVAEFAAQHPHITQDVTKIKGPTFSADIARPAIRSVMLSEPYQKRFSNVSPYQVSPMMTIGADTVAPAMGMMAADLPYQNERR